MAKRHAPDDENNEEKLNEPKSKNTKIAIDEILGIVDDDNQTKELIFCNGAHGEKIISITAKTCPVYFALPHDTIVFCLSDNHHHNDKDSSEEKNTVCMPYPEKVSHYDVDFFVHLAYAKTSQILADLEAWLRVQAQLPVNYILVVRLCRSFLVEACEKLEKEMNTYLSRQPYFVHPVSALSAYYLTKTFQLTAPPGCMYEESFDFKHRLTYCCAHGQIAEFYRPQRMTKDHVSKILGVDRCLLELLDGETCVIAGGACVKLAKPETKLDERSDVDFFVLNQPNSQKAIVTKLVHLLVQSGRVLYTSATQDVITALGPYGVRRIQVIVCYQKDVRELMNSFDLPIVRSYYDGKQLHATIGAHLDWFANTCSNHTNRPIKAARLYGLHCKGFELAPECQDYLKHTSFGWPVSPEKHNTFINMVPCISKDLPPNVQDAILANAFRMYRLKLPQDENQYPLRSAEVPSSAFLVHDTVHGYTEHNKEIFHGSIDEYIETCLISATTSPLHKNSYSGAVGWLHTQVSVPYVIELNSVELDVVDEKASPLLYTIHGTQFICREMLFEHVPQTFVSKMNQRIKGTEKPFVYDRVGVEMNVRIANGCLVYANGVLFSRVRMPPADRMPFFLKTCHRHVRVLIKPAYLYFREDHKVRLRWEIVSLFVTHNQETIEDLVDTPPVVDPFDSPGTEERASTLLL